MKTLFFVIFLSFSWLQAKSQPIYVKMSEYQELVYNSFGFPIDTLESRFNLIFTEKYPDLLQKHEGTVYKFTINLDTLGCITNIKNFPNQKTDNDLFDTIEDLLKYHHTCKKMMFKKENGEISTIRFFYFTIVFINSKIKIGVA